jgi:hypothetical protein
VYAKGQNHPETVVRPLPRSVDVLESVLKVCKRLFFKNYFCGTFLVKLYFNAYFV